MESGFEDDFAPMQSSASNGNNGAVVDDAPLILETEDSPSKVPPEGIVPLKSNNCFHFLLLIKYYLQILEISMSLEMI